MGNLAELHPSWMTRMKDGLLGKLDCNVILVNWPKGSLPPYAQATGNTRLVGAMIGELIKFLISQTQGSADLFHVVGFSLGAQIAGYTGSHLRTAGLKLGRITGNDYPYVFPIYDRAVQNTAKPSPPLVLALHDGLKKK